LLNVIISGNVIIPGEGTECFKIVALRHLTEAKIIKMLWRIILELILKD
jgi:hypothetical protein